MVLTVYVVLSFTFILILSFVFLQGKDARAVFHSYLNICPHQGSRTIRTEVTLTTTCLLFQLVWEMWYRIDSCSYSGFLNLCHWKNRKQSSCLFNIFKNRFSVHCRKDDNCGECCIVTFLILYCCDVAAKQTKLGEIRLQLKNMGAFSWKEFHNRLACD